MVITLAEISGSSPLSIAASESASVRVDTVMSSSSARAFSGSVFVSISWIWQASLQQNCPRGSGLSRNVGAASSAGSRW